MKNTSQLLFKVSTIHSLVGSETLERGIKKIQTDTRKIGMYKIFPTHSVFLSLSLSLSHALS